MAALKLNTTSSIVDFLKSKGEPSDYNSRLSTYNTSGIQDRLGPYVGSATQHIALLKQLNTPKSTGVIEPATVGRSTLTASQAPVESPVPTEPSTIGNSGLTASQALSSIPQFPSTDEILSKVLGSPKFQNYQLGKEAQSAYDIGTAATEKQKLAGEAASNTQAFIDKMGKRGLFFSGETQSGIQALASSLASSTLGVDRKLANTLIQSDTATSEKIMSQVEKVVSEAQAGRKEAITALEKVGLAIVGDKVVPTLTAQNAILSEANRQADNVRADAAQAIALQRLELSQASADRAEDYLKLAEARAAKADAEDSDTITLSNADKASVRLYGSMVDQVLAEPDANGQTATPAEAVQVATAAAAASGTTLSTTNQVALLDYANRRAVEISADLREKQSVSAVEASFNMTFEEAQAFATKTRASEIEAEVARMKRGGILNDGDIRAALYNRYPKKEVDQSSVGATITKIGALFGF